jgi:hypothetical protein
MLESAAKPAGVSRTVLRSFSAFKAAYSEQVRLWFVPKYFL